MLSDEEKKAIERLNKRYEFFKENPLATNVWLTLDIHNLGIALNLIEKQSKEIEDHIENKELINQTLGLEKNANINKTLERIIILNNYEDKIKAIIEEIHNEPMNYNPDEYWIENECKGYAIDRLQSLLEKE